MAVMCTITTNKSNQLDETWNFEWVILKLKPFEI